MSCLNDGYWSTRKERCFCQYQWTGRNCSKWRHHRCFFDDGFSYRGFLSETDSGDRCAPWSIDSNALYPLDEDGIGVHNFCRNPGQDPKGLWCYVSGGKFFEYCNATRCPDTYRVNLTNFDVEIGDEDTTVNFLYGPLIIGICAGMVSLILIFVLTDCIRRKKCCFRKRTKAEQNDPEKDPVEDSEIDHNSEADEVDELKILGGIVTVNIDTGEHKRQHFNEEEWNDKYRKDGTDNPAYRKATSLYDARSVSSGISGMQHASNKYISSSNRKAVSAVRGETASLPPTAREINSRRIDKQKKRPKQIPETTL